MQSNVKPWVIISVSNYVYAVAGLSILGVPSTVLHRTLAQVVQWES